MNSLVNISSEGAIRVVTLNRPDKRNALSIPMRRELATTFARLSGDPDVAVVVLTGAGSHFCSGMDTTQFGGDDENRRALLESTAGLFGALRSLARPVLAAIEGSCIAGGLALAAGADIRICSPDAMFWMPEVTLGFAQSWGTLRGALPDQIARRVAFTGEKFSADQVLEWGFVMEVRPDPMARCMDLAGKMAKNPISGLEGSKRLMIDAADDSLRRALDAEMRIFEASLFRPRP